MEEIEKAIRSGKLQGEWEVKPIEEPGAKGYVARGRFQLGEPLTLPKQAVDEVREPLTDVFEDKDHVKLYVELPGVEKNDIQLNVTEGRAEVKAKNFYKVVDLPTRDVEFEKAIANYKNGVLEVTIPKKEKTASEDEKKTIKIE
jgi:HSP20 family molecular chaperone IbpA